MTRRLFVGLLAGVTARLAWLQLVDGPRYASAAESQRTNVATLHAKRGTIYDRNGNILAMSVECETIYANPKAISDPSGVSDLLVEHIGGEKSDYMQLLTQDTTFVYVKQKVDQEPADALAAALLEADLAGVYFMSDTKRVYPYGTAGAQVVGYVGTDGTGLSGLELYYNDVLTGTDGEMILETGVDGTPIAGGVSQVTEAKDGTDLMISIDIDLQTEAEKIIAESVEHYEAESGSVMVTDPRNGEILAACSTPLPDFSNLTDVSSLNLRLVTDAYEPGSVFKVITTSIGLDLDLFTPDTVYSVPGRYKVGDDYVTDYGDEDYSPEDMSVTYMMVHSSNPGMALLVQEVIGAEKFSEGVDRFAIGHLTGIDFPGETRGIVKTLDEYDGATAGSMAFGQALSVPMVQIVRAFGAVANDGVMTTPHFLVYRGEEEVSWPQGGQVISKETADTETEMMRQVMREGTGKGGQVEGFDFAGKTGTGEQASAEGGYQENHYMSSLCGFANADSPDVLVYAGLNGTYLHADQSSVKIFQRVAEKAVSIMGVAPSDRAE